MYGASYEYKKSLNIQFSPLEWKYLRFRLQFSEIKDSEFVYGDEKSEAGSSNTFDRLVNMDLMNS